MFNLRTRLQVNTEFTLSPPQTLKTFLDISNIYIWKKQGKDWKLGCFSHKLFGEATVGFCVSAHPQGLLLGVIVTCAPLLLEFKTLWHWQLDLLLTIYPEHHASSRCYKTHTSRSRSDEWQHCAHHHVSPLFSCRLCLPNGLSFVTPRRGQEFTFRCLCKKYWCLALLPRGSDLLVWGT